jgi:hypothetical protein
MSYLIHNLELRILMDTLAEIEAHIVAILGQSLIQM